MTYQQKLVTLLKITGKTQTELAQQLQVSFVTFNSWINSKSTPRKNALEKIDLLYQDYTGVTEVTDSELSTKKQEIAAYKKQFPNPLQYMLQRQDIYEAFVLELTYHTNSIEGSTFTEPQVRAVIFDGVTIPDKTVVEHQEAKNHQAALGNIMQWLTKHQQSKQITEEWIKKLHSILMNGIRADAGSYRRHGVRIVGSNVPTTNYLRVNDRMQEFVRSVQTKSDEDTIKYMARVHAQFEKIHPFSDGNGRVGRLLMHVQALQHGLPPVLIKQEKKQAYYTYLQKAQLEKKYIFLESFIYDALLESYVLLKTTS
ncbi:MAG: Fic family protein [Candidatus Kerfeldbacteria bacterium]|nr:Fic family protein [Candidatus Kerfeldbacteria bacterium]